MLVIHGGGGVSGETKTYYLQIWGFFSWNDAAVSKEKKIPKC